ncbi:MAG: hypothetical protein FJ280_26200 [Planctomycetes bacterium]|nr:hypothetical protein [Planctomycetota bacterium]
MAFAYEADQYEVPAESPIERFDRRALEARLREADAFDAGEPNQMLDTPLHPQGDKPDCLLRSAQMAEHQQTGHDPGLDAFKQPAIERGVYDPGGGVTDLPQFVEAMNERPDIQAELYRGDGPQDIKDALDHGESVIACVDSYEFYKDVCNLEPNSGQHAIVVTGAGETAEGGWQFTVNDPNIEVPNVPVDGERFLTAWDAANRPMITVEKV